MEVAPDVDVDGAATGAEEVDRAAAAAVAAVGDAGGGARGKSVRVCTKL
jgi:hypothetical protein